MLSFFISINIHILWYIFYIYYKTHLDHFIKVQGTIFFKTVSLFQESLLKRYKLKISVQMVKPFGCT